MPVNNPFSINAGIQYVDGTPSSPSNFTGTVAMSLNANDFIVGLRSDAADNLLIDLAALAGVSLGGPTLWGTAATGEQVQGVNAELFAGNAALSSTAYGSPAVQALDVYIVNPVTATFTETSIGVTQITTPWVVGGNLTHNNAAPGANNVGVLPAIANTAAPTYTAGDQVLLSTDLSGQLRVSITGTNSVTQGTSPWVTNVTQWDSTALGAPSNYGTSPGAVTVIGVNAFVTNTVTITGTVAATQSGTWNIGTLTSITNPVAVTQSGTWTVQQGSAPWSQNVTQWDSTALGAPSNYGTSPGAVNVIGVNAFVTNTVTVTGTVTANQGGTWTVQQGSAPWSQNITQWDSTALGAPSAYGTSPGAVNVIGVNAFITNIPAVTQSGTWTVQQGSAPWSLVGTLTNNNAAPGANNVGVLPALAGTAVPTYTTGDQVLLSTDLSGQLRVTVTGTNSVTQGTSPWVTNVTQWDSTALGAPSSYGTSPGAVNVIGVNAFITNTVTVTGTVTANQGGAPWSQNLTQVAGTVLGATAVTNFGTAPAAAAVPGVNASLFAGTTGLTATGSSLNANVTNTVTVSGTITANQGGAPWSLVGTLTNNNAAPGANNVGVLPAVASTAAPTYTTGDQVLLSTDLSGNLRVSLTGTNSVTQGTSPWVTNVTQWDSTALGAPSSYGTSPGAVTVIGVNAFITNIPAVTQSGTWTVQQGSAPWSLVGTLTNNNAAPGANNVGVLPALAGTTAPTYTTGDQVLLSTDLSGNLRVSITGTNTISGTVTANQGGAPWSQNVTQWDSTALGAPSAYGTSPGAVTVIGVNAFITNTVTVTGTVTANQGGTWTVQQGSAPWSLVGTLTNNNAAPGANNVGALTGVASTAVPTYTTGDQVLLSTDLSGQLRVTVTGTNSVTQGTSPWVTNVTQWDSTALGAPSNYGTSPGAVTVIGVNAFITNIPAVTQSGTWTVQQGSAPWSQNVTQWDSTALGAPSNYGTSPGAVTVIGVNAFITNTVTITGTVTANQGGAPWSLVGTLTNNNAAPAANNVGVLPAIANTAAPTYTNGDQVLLSTDLSGNLRATITTALPAGANTIGAVTQASGPWTTNVTQWDSTALGAPSAYGTSPGAVNVIGVNAFITNTVAVSQSGTWNIGTLTSITNPVAVTGTFWQATQPVSIANLSFTSYGSPAQQGANVYVLNPVAVTQSGTWTVQQGTPPWVAGGVYNTTEPAPAPTATTALQQDQAANLLNFPGVQFKAGTAWTSATAVGTFQYPTGTATQGQVSGAPAYLVQLDQGTTLTGGAVTFQGTYDNINWVTIPLAQVLSPISYDTLTNPYTFVPSTNTAFLILSNGYVGIRADLSTVITGTGSVTPYWTTLATTPVQTVQNQPLTIFTTGTAWASGTAAGTTQFINSPGSGTLPPAYLVQLDQGAGFTAGAITFQVTADGINWVTIPALAVLDPTTLEPITLPYTLVSSTNRAFMLRTLGYTGFRMEVSTTTAGGTVTPYWSELYDPSIVSTSIQYQTTVPSLTANQSVSMQSDAVGSLYVDTEGRKPTYTAFAFGNISSAGDFAVLQGSATKTIRILAIEASITTTGTAGFAVIQLIRGTPAPTGGTFTNPTPAPTDTNYAAATATVYAYTVPPTGGVVGVGNVKGARVLDAPATTAVQPALLRWVFPSGPGASALVLRGVNDCVAINLNAIIATQSYTFAFEWVEDNS